MEVFLGDVDDEQRWVLTANNKLKNKGTGREVPLQWYLSEKGEGYYEVEQLHENIVLWINDIEDNNDIPSGLDVSVVNIGESNYYLVQNFTTR